MSAQANGSPFKYKVEISSFIKAEIKTLAKQAAALRQQQASFDAWLEIEKRLQSKPLQSGECHYYMSKGKLRCHIGVVGPVAVEFAIHEEKRAVVLLKVSLLGI
jgi:mRNA-degrading endonuclease RelE of RelBE toxin-antitoxin system